LEATRSRSAKYLRVWVEGLVNDDQDAMIYANMILMLMK